MKYRIAKLLLVLCCVAFLGAFEVSCNERDNTLRFAGPLPLAQVSPAGIYRGTFTTSVGSDPVAANLIAIVSEHSDVQFIFGFGNERHAAGTVSVDGTSLRGTLTEYRGALGRFLGTAGAGTTTLDGAVEETIGISGGYAGTIDEGRFNLQYDTLYESVSSLGLTTGVWALASSSSSGAIYNITWDIDNDGLIFGADSMGCVFLGNVDIIDSDFNAYRLTVDVTSCGELNGRYSGLAFLTSPGVDMERLTLGISNDTYAFAASLDR